METTTNLKKVIPITPAPAKLQKRIGSTVYIINVYTSPTAKETVQDKILRLIESEVRKSA